MHGRGIALFAAAGRASAAPCFNRSMQPPTIDDIRAAAAADRRRGRPHADAQEPHLERDHRRGSLAEVREPAVHRRLQGTRRAQQIAAADARGACARRDRGVGRQPCAGGRLSRQAARHSGDDRHAGVHADDQSDADRGPWRDTSSCTATSSTTRSSRRASWKPRGLRLRPRRSTIRRLSRGRARIALEMLEDAPELDTIVVPIGGGGIMSGDRALPRARSSRTSS